LGAEAAVIVQAKYYPHYYQLWLPALAVGAAWGIVTLGEIMTKRFLPYVFTACAAAAILIFEMPQFYFTPEQLTQAKYGDDLFAKTRDMSFEVNKLLAPDETFWEWGAETGLYFYSKRKPPSGVIYNYALKYLSDPALTERLDRRVISDLSAKPPELIVFYSPTPGSFSNKVLLWIDANYRTMPAAVQHPPFVLLMRKGGRLDSKWTGATSKKASESSSAP
jgi:hypothetical protein